MKISAPEATTPRFWPTSVRSRLLLAFAVTFASAMALALVGWIGARDTQEALSDFQSHVLPDVARSLELSQRTAAIAAMAPYVAESTRPFQLQTEAEEMLSRLAAAERLAAELPAEPRRDLDVAPALAALKASIIELIEVTRTDLFVQEDLREYIYRLTSVANEIPPPGDREAVAAILRDLTTAIEVSDPEMLAVLRERVEAEAARIGRSNLASSRLVNLVRDNLEAPDSVFVLRTRQFTLRERKAFLVSRTRAEAERLGEHVNAYVRNARSEVERRGQSLARAAHSGALGIAILTLVSIVVAALGILIVVRLVGSLGSITRVMSRLAQGDTEQATPETARPDELGAMARAFEVFRDNARAVRRMANDIREQGELLSSVLENMRDGLSVFDRDGRLLVWNPPFPALLGLPPEAIHQGMDCRQIRHLLDDKVRGGTLHLAEFDPAQQPSASRFELHFADERVIEVRSNRLPDGGLVMLYSDLTERRAFEAKSQQTQKLEVLGQLTGGVAHDFNNLLAAITGNLYLLEQEDGLGERARRFATRASSAAARGATLTQRLLAFARQQPLIPSAVDIDTFIRDLVDLIDYSAGQNVSLLLDLGAAGACAWVDRGQLENALLNLAINARDAMPDGGTLRLTTRSVSGERIAIEVADSGEGMSPETREHVFEPFFTTKAGSGNGLGLSIVYGFIKQSGGDILIDSLPGRGTTFTLLLPASQSQHIPIANPLDAPSAQIPVAPQSLLLVEDNPEVRVALADRLRFAGHQVTVTATAEEALDRIAHDHFSCVLSDVDLGGSMHGLALTQRLAEDHRSLPCVLMSGLPPEILATRFGLNGQLPRAPLLSKPFSNAQFDDALREAMSSVASEPS